MELYIQIRNGQPFEHPILGDNFRQAFPHIDTNNLPPEFAKFERVKAPALGPYSIYEGVTYEWQGNLVTDIHHVRQMTNNEKISKQNETKVNWAEYGFASWVFDEDTCSFIAPTPKPVNDKIYRWDEPTTSWIEVAP
jgi:hypothetical protein